MDDGRSIFISDEGCFSPALFNIQSHYKDSISTLLIPHGLILDRVDKLASDILNQYKGRTPHLICVLKGGSIFFSDLLRALNKRHCNSSLDYIPYTFDFIKVSSYEGLESTGTVKVDMGNSNLAALKGRNLIFVEDIIDTGLTMVKLMQFFNERTECAAIETITLLEKRTSRSNGYKANYVGFSIPDRFVIGYGLDYNESFRDMSHIAVISEEGIAKYK